MASSRRLRKVAAFVVPIVILGASLGVGYLAGAIPFINVAQGGAGLTTTSVKGGGDYRTLDSTTLKSTVTSTTQAGSEGAVQASSAVEFFSITYNTYINWLQPLSASAVYLTADSINFSNAIFGTGQSYSFGLGVNYCNLSIQGISQNEMTLNFSAKSSGQSYCYLWFYYTAALIPTEISSSATGAAILQKNYLLTLSSFNQASGDAVYLNSASNYVEYKTESTPTVLEISVAQ
jgi:hypothetical protein